MLAKITVYMLVCVHQAPFLAGTPLCWAKAAVHSVAAVQDESKCQHNMILNKRSMVYSAAPDWNPNSPKPCMHERAPVAKLVRAVGT